MQTNTTEDKHLIVNNNKEEVELKNLIKTQGIFYRKERFGVLTTNRLLIFKNQSHFIENKNPRKSFVLMDFDFSTQRETLNISRQIEENKQELIKKIFFPNQTICVHWWETIKHLKVKLIDQTKKFNELLPLDKNEDYDYFKNEYRMTNRNILGDLTLDKEVNLMTQSFNNFGNLKITSIPSMPSVSNSCFEIIPNSTIYKLKIEKQEFSLVGNSEINENTNEPSFGIDRNQLKENDLINNSDDSDVPDIRSPFTKSITHKIPSVMNVKHKVDNVREFELGEFCNKEKKEEVVKSKVNNNDQGIKLVKKINKLENKNREDYFRNIHYDDRSNRQVIKVLKAEFVEEKFKRTLDIKRNKENKQVPKIPKIRETNEGIKKIPKTKNEEKKTFLIRRFENEPIVLKSNKNNNSNIYIEKNTSEFVKEKQKLITSKSNLKGVQNQLPANSLIEKTIQNCFNEELLFKIVASGEKGSGISDKLELIVNSFMEKIKNSSNLLCQILEKLPSLITRSLQRLDTSLVKFKSVTQTSLLPKKILIILVKDLESLKELIYNTVSRIPNNKEYKPLLISKERNFLVQMNCLKALITLKIVN